MPEEASQKKKEQATIQLNGRPPEDAGRLIQHVAPEHLYIGTLYDELLGDLSSDESWYHDDRKEEAKRRKEAAL